HVPSLALPGPKAGRSYGLSPVGQPAGEAGYDVVLDAPSAQPDRVRDGAPRRVPVRDHDESAQAEEVCAAVRLRVEPLAQAARRRPDEQAAELARRGGRDLLAEGVEQVLDRPFEQLQGDVAGEAVGDDDVRC